MIIRRNAQVKQDRYPRVPRYAIANNELGHKSLHVGDLTFLPGSSVPHHYHNEGAEETQLMLDGELECWIDGNRTTVRGGDTVTAPPGIRHAFYNRTDEPARMITAFPLTPPETIHVDEPELENVVDHPSIVRAGSRTGPYATDVDGVVLVELSGDFSGAKSTYTYVLEIEPRAAVPAAIYRHEVAIFLVEGDLRTRLGAGPETDLHVNDASVVEPGKSVALSNRGPEPAKVAVVHPVLNTAFTRTTN